ncbi:MAG: GNAT family N-acetyltransferase [Chloroflexi bacterium]|nr:GNAT family N-acetyltransferase [Chloroflexota bacterium]
MATVAVAHTERAIVARATSDRQLLRAFLERDRLLAAYALCDLDDREFRRTRWAVASSGGSSIAVGLEYSGLSPQPLFLMGEPEGISAILRDVIRPRAAYVAVLPDQVAAASTHYRLDPGPQMVRMWVNAERFRRYPSAAVVRLDASDAPDLNRLYGLGFGAWLPPRAVAAGVYYGIRVNGRLVAAAGTHVVSRIARLAVVGNVLTHVDFRGRGYATAVTGAVTATLLQMCDAVVLNVRADNPPALNAYRRLGYAEHVRFEERLARRITPPWSEVLANLIRRFASGREGRSE